jgi:hypothetical protein
MKRVSASHAMQNFDEVLSSAMVAPVAIERQGIVVAVLARPDMVTLRDPLEVCRQARADQQAVENARLMKHQEVAIRLLSIPLAEATALVALAQEEVDRWEALKTCSKDYIDLWREILRLSIPEIANAICSDWKGWGNALRQNSPWRVALQ